MPRVDAHAHLVSEAYRGEIAGRGFEGILPPVATPEQLEASMDRYGIDASVISTPPPGAWIGDAALARELARSVNEDMARVARERPQRFAALATLPLPDVDAALTEIAFALDELRLDGVALFSNHSGVYLGDPRFDPIFDELERRAAFVFVHPTAPPGPIAPAPPVWVAEFPFDTTRAAINLIYSGTLERCPSVRIQLAHLGGAAPFLAHRIAEWAKREPESGNAAPAGVLAYLKRLWFDTGLANNPIAVGAVRELVGVERIVFGTDWPFAVLPDGGDPAPDLGLDEPARSLVDGANVANLLPRLASLLADSERGIR